MGANAPIYIVSLPNMLHQGLQTKNAQERPCRNVMFQRQMSIAASFARLELQIFYFLLSEIKVVKDCVLERDVLQKSTVFAF